MNWVMLSIRFASLSWVAGIWAGGTEGDSWPKSRRFSERIDAREREREREREEETDLVDMQRKLVASQMVDADSFLNPRAVHPWVMELNSVHVEEHPRQIGAFCPLHEED